MNVLDDNQIIDLFFQRSEDAIKNLQVKYANLIYTIANNILSNEEDSEEVLNDIYLQVWNVIPPEHPESLKAYLSALTRNRALNISKAQNALKRGKGEATVVYEELEEILSGESGPEEFVETEQLKGTINRFARGLKKDRQQIFVARYFYFEKEEDIASKLGFSVGKVKMTLNRCRNELKDYLRSEGYSV